VTARGDVLTLADLIEGAPSTLAAICSRPPVSRPVTPSAVAASTIRRVWIVPVAPSAS
jgi:hypothetical protein